MREGASSRPGFIVAGGAAAAFVVLFLAAAWLDELRVDIDMTMVAAALPAVAVPLVILSYWKPRFTWRTVILFQLLVTAAIACWVSCDPWRRVSDLTEQRDEHNRGAISPDGRLVVTSGEGPSARVWDARTGECLSALTGHHDNVFAAAFTPDGARIVTWGHDLRAMVWSASTCERLRVLRRFRGPVYMRSSAPGLQLRQGRTWGWRISVWRRTRPGGIWTWLLWPQYWAMVAFGGALAWSIGADARLASPPRRRWRVPAEPGRGIPG